MFHKLGKTLVFTGTVLYLTSSLTLAAEKPSPQTKAKDDKIITIKTEGVKTANPAEPGSRRANISVELTRVGTPGKSTTPPRVVNPSPDFDDDTEMLSGN